MNDRSCPLFSDCREMGHCPNGLICCDIDGSCVTDEELCGEEHWVFPRSGVDTCHTSDNGGKNISNQQEVTSTARLIIVGGALWWMGLLPIC